MREICTSGSEEGFAGVTQQIYSTVRHPEPERSEGEGSPKLGTVPLPGDPSRKKTRSG